MLSQLKPHVRIQVSVCKKMRNFETKIRQKTWPALVDDFRTFDWAQTIAYPESVYQQTVSYLG